MEPKYTTTEMREMSRGLLTDRPFHQFELNRISSALDWAANVIDAANEALKPQRGIE